MNLVQESCYNLSMNTNALINRKDKMVNGFSIGVIPQWVRNIWLFKEISGIPQKDSFLLSPKLYSDLFSDNPGVLVVGIVIHELEHIKRAREIGYWKYQLLYKVNPKFRYNEELECHKPQFVYYKKEGYDFDLNERARILSGSLYLWPVNYEKALKDLTGLWEKV